MKDPALIQVPDEPILAAFAAILLGFSPLDPTPEAVSIAAMAARLAEPRPAHGPGDVEATRAFRSVYALAKERPTEPRAGYRADPDTATRAWIVLSATLDLRHRQRAALALRHVFRLPTVGVARVLGVSRNRAGEILEAAAANTVRACGGRIDVARHLRSIGELVRSNGRPGPSGEHEEPRSVVKVLLSSVAEAPAARGRSLPSAAPVARPVYRVRETRTAEPPAAPAPIAAKRSSRRTGLLVAACVAALAFLGTFAPTALLGRPAPLPLAAVPIAPVVEEAVQPAVQAAAAPIVYRVKTGDTLWSIAGAELGDAGRWREVWRSNSGRLMADGTRFLDPDLIRPGWRLRLPPR